MGARRTRRQAAVLGLAVLLVVAQVFDIVWPRADSRAASPASVLFCVTLLLLLALYPNGWFVPRWTAAVSVLGGVVFIAAAVAGPDVSASFLWPLPIAPFLLALVFGGQGYRYLRRSNAAEREAVRWPLLGVLLVVTLVVPADLLSLALTGHTIQGGPAIGAVMQLALLLPAAGFVLGMILTRADLVDRVLAGWLSVVTAAAVLGCVFAVASWIVSLFAPSPWPAWVGAGGVAIAAVWVIPLAGRLGRRVVFRGRSDPGRAVALLTNRLRATLDAGQVPVEVVAAVADATGARAVVLRRSGQVGSWAEARSAEQTGDSAPYQTEIHHLGLAVATLTVWPRAGESSLTAEDCRIVSAMADAAAPAVHGARLASAFPELTERERQVLAGIVQGIPNSAIAARLGISGKTVANYVSIVLLKLRVPDKERAAELARRRTAELH